jgi:hypothetical protein
LLHPPYWIDQNTEICKSSDPAKKHLYWIAETLQKLIPPVLFSSFYKLNIKPII